MTMPGDDGQFDVARVLLYQERMGWEKMRIELEVTSLITEAVAERLEHKVDQMRTQVTEQQAQIPVALSLIDEELAQLPPPPQGFVPPPDQTRAVYTELRMRYANTETKLGIQMRIQQRIATQLKVDKSADMKTLSDQAAEVVVALDVLDELLHTLPPAGRVEQNGALHAHSEGVGA